MWLSFSLQDTSLRGLINFHLPFESQHRCHFLQGAFSCYNCFIYTVAYTASGFLSSSQLITLRPSCGYNYLYSPLDSKQREGRGRIPSVQYRMVCTEQVFINIPSINPHALTGPYSSLGIFTYILSFNLFSNKPNLVLCARMVQFLEHSLSIRLRKVNINISDNSRRERK